MIILNDIIYYLCYLMFFPFRIRLIDFRISLTQKVFFLGNETTFFVRKLVFVFGSSSTLKNQEEYSIPIRLSNFSIQFVSFTLLQLIICSDYFVLLSSTHFNLLICHLNNLNDLIISYLCVIYIIIIIIISSVSRSQKTMVRV